MGGVRNRDAKLAKNKVFTSGAGGSAKGPAVIDKRGLDLQCPHCERIFKQPGRLQDHIKKQHEAEAEAEAEEAEAASPSTAAPAAAAKPAAAAAAPRMMDVGSSAGAYDVKSPKLILHEMLLRNKQPRPRYKAIPAPDATWRCKVVLPHPKQPSDKDIVIFLDDAHAAPSEDEAMQRAAVAALHHIAGERALDRILPRAFVPLWQDLGRQLAQRTAREQRDEERRAQRQVAQQAAMKRRQPAAVIMTEDKRRMVENIISEVRSAARGAPSASTAAQDDGDNEDGSSAWGAGPTEASGAWESYGDPLASGSVDPVQPEHALEDDLVVLGFREVHARQAVAASCSGGGGATLSAALDWLCLNVDEGLLPTNFAPGAAGKPLTVLRRAPSSSATSALRAAPSASSLASAEADAESMAAAEAAAQQDPAAAELLQFGYPPALCLEALQQAGGHLHEAMRWLYCRLTRPGSEAAAAPEDYGIEEWLDEREALEAIYGSEVTFLSDKWTALRLNVLLDGAAAAAAAAHSGRPKEALMVDGAELELHAWAPAAGPYPQLPPTLALTSPDVASRVLLTLTHRLGELCASLTGQPMLYEVASAVGELLPECLVRPRTLQALFNGGAAEGEASRVAAAAERQEDVGASVKARGAKGGRREHHHQPRREWERRPPSSLDIAAESCSLLQRQRELESSAKHASMRSARARLPAFSQRSEVAAAVAGSPVVVVSGATGCGKSTQVPQYILEEATSAGAGASCNIICTQPRRISAVGLATRVAAERGEGVGDVVGYSVRLDSRQSKRTRLLFCTTGVLLRRLLSDPGLGGTTHVILDEVHERSIESDLLLMLLKRMMAAGLNPGVHVVLMSATADAQLFASYFEAALHRPVALLTIPGFTHPVTDLFLEDALEASGFFVGKSSKWAKKAAGKDKDRRSGDDGGGSADGLGSGTGGYSRQTAQSLQNIDEAQVNYDLIEALVVHVAGQELGGRGGGAGEQGGRPGGAVLVFAPGADEISRVVRALQGSGRLAAAAPGGVRVLPLHGGLPPAQQAKVFERPPQGVLKVVVATNVAETSITIDDITASAHITTCVIDTGRVKEMRFDADRGIARLLEGWVSRAAAQQRRGRAGRVRPGTCYRLFSRKTWANMARDTPPEVARAPLQGLVMDVKGILRDADVAHALADMITPPDAAAVAQAVGSLQAVGALDRSTQALTPLGRHLTRMPCDPRIGKMLVFGAMLRCLDPVLTIAAAQGFGRPAFFSPPDRREEAEAARTALIKGVAASKSDHLAVVAAYNAWRAAVSRGGRSAASEVCSRYFVSEQAMEAIHAGRRQYADILADLGFVPGGYPSASTSPAYNPGSVGAGTRSGGSAGSADSTAFTLPGGPDQFAGHARIVKAVLCAGLYPQLLRVDHPNAKYQQMAGGAFEVDTTARQLKFFDRERGRVFLHPSSSNFARGRFESGWLVYSELVQTSKVFVRESTMVPVYAVLLFGGELSVHHEASLVRVDGWSQFRAPARIAVLVRELRAEVAALLGRKVEDPGIDLGASRVVDAMHHLLSTDGF